MRHWILGTLAVAAAAAPALAADYVNTPIARETTTISGQPISPPANATIVASTSIFPPGSKTRVHKHPYPHYVFVTEGTLTVTNAETGKQYEVTAGHFIVEMMDTWHFGQNNGTVPVKTYVVDQLPAGVADNRIFQDDAPKP